jgi:hypothetical protein
MKITSQANDPQAGLMMKNAGCYTPRRPFSTTPGAAGSAQFSHDKGAMSVF